MAGKKLMILLVTSILLLSGCSLFETSQKNEVLENTSSHEQLPDSFTNGETVFSVQSDEENYTLPVDEIILIISNSGSRDIGFGEYRVLEKFQEGIWYEVPYIE